MDVEVRDVDGVWFTPFLMLVVAGPRRGLGEAGVVER